MTQQLSMTEARATLPALLDAVEQGEEITLTRHGKPAAVLVRPDRLRVRRADDAFAAAREIHDLLEEARTRPLSPTADPGISRERAEELVQYVYDSRSAR